MALVLPLRGVWWISTTENNEITVCITVTKSISGQKIRLHNRGSIDHLTAPLILAKKQIYVQRLAISDAGEVPYLLASIDGDKQSMALTQVKNMNEQISPLYLSHLRGGDFFSGFIAGAAKVISDVEKKAVQEVLALIYSL